MFIYFSKNYKIGEYLERSRKLFSDKEEVFWRCTSCQQKNQKKRSLLSQINMAKRRDEKFQDRDEIKETGRD